MPPDTLTSLLARLRSASRRARGPSDRTNHGVYRTRALRRFITGLQSQPGPVILDLGPVNGTSLSFLGDRLGCKVFIEDLFGDLDTIVRTGRAGQLAQYLASRFPHGEHSIDGVFCWDLVDYLPDPAARVLAAQLMRVLRPGGLLLALVAMIPYQGGYRTDYVIEDDEHLRHRLRSTSLTSQPVRLRRDVERLFGELQVEESFLLLHHQQEFLFRKPPEGHPWPVPSSRS